MKVPLGVKIFSVYFFALGLIGLVGCIGWWKRLLAQEQCWAALGLLALVPLCCLCVIAGIGLWRLQEWTWYFAITLGCVLVPAGFREGIDLSLKPAWLIAHYRLIAIEQQLMHYAAWVIGLPVLCYFLRPSVKARFVPRSYT